MSRNTVLILATLMFFFASLAWADKVEWSENGDKRIKSVYNDQGDLIYQAEYDRKTGKRLRELLDVRTSQSQSSPRAVKTRPGRRLTLPVDTLVRIRILETLNSKVNRTGDSFRFSVSETVSYEGRTWIRKGTSGRGLLNKVRRAGRFGQNGKIDASFGQVTTTSGRPVMLTISKKAKEHNDQEKMAAGASFLGAVALGPIGLAAGAFVKGEDITIAAGSELYVATEQSISW